MKASSFIDSSIFANEKIVSNIPPSISVHVIVLNLLDLFDTINDIVATVPVRMMADYTGSFMMEVIFNSKWKSCLPVSSRDEVICPDLAFDVSLRFWLRNIEKFGSQRKPRRI